MGQPIILYREDGSELTVYGEAQKQVELAAGALLDKPTAKTKTPVGLPADFPAADVLTKAGFADMEAVRNTTDEELGAIKGIGEATLKAIREASK